MTDQTNPQAGAGAAAPAAGEASAADLWAEVAALDEDDAGDGPSIRIHAEPEDHVVRADGNEAAAVDQEDKTPAKDTTNDEPPAADADTVEALRAQVAKLEQQVRSANGRASAHQRKYDDLKRQVTTTAQAVTDTRRAIAEQKRNEEKLKKSQQDYPDVVTPLAANLTAIQRQQANQLKRDEANLADKQQELETHKAEQLALFNEQHPDGIQVIIDNREAFDAWLDDQPGAIRRAYKANEEHVVDAEQAALVVGKFKLALAEAQGAKGSSPTKTQKSGTDAKRQLQLAGASAPRTPTNPRTSSAPGEGASQAEWWEHFKREEEEEERRTRGR